MKSAGLNQNFRRMLRQTTKMTAFSTLQTGHLAAKEKQRTLRIQAERAQFARQKKEAEANAKPSQS